MRMNFNFNVTFNKRKLCYPSNGASLSHLSVNRPGNINTNIMNENDIFIGFLSRKNNPKARKQNKILKTWSVRFVIHMVTRLDED